MPLDITFTSNLNSQDLLENIIALETLDSIAYNLRIEIDSILNTLPTGLGLLSSSEILENIDDELLLVKLKQLLTSERIIHKVMWLLHFSTMLKRALVLTSNSHADFLWEVLSLLADLEALDTPPCGPRLFLGEDVSEGLHKLLIPIQDAFHAMPLNQYTEIHQLLHKRVNALRSITEGFLISLISGDRKTMAKDEFRELFWISALTATLQPFVSNRSLLIESIDFLLNRALELELWNLGDLLSQSLRRVEKGV